MVKKVQRYIQSSHMIEQGDRVVVGVSGGADSVALLFVLKELQAEFGLQLFVVHINHGIRQEAIEDVAYVQQLCKALLIPFYLYEADIPAMAKEQGCTEEEMGRLYRYQCFGEVMEQVGACKLAVAHHMDDQAETMLFHMIRGTRLVGMEGMRPVTEFWLHQQTTKVDAELPIHIIRPLLCCRKCEIEDWLQRKNISWKEDYTNANNTYSRNSIRNQVVPVLEQVNVKAVEHMAELAEEMSAYRDFLRKTVDAYMQENVISTIEKADTNVEEGTKEWNRRICECNRAHLLKQEKIVTNAVIYEMLAMVCGRKKDLSCAHVQAVYNLLNNQSGRRISLPYKMEAEIAYEKLIIRKRLEETGISDKCEIEILIDEEAWKICDEMSWWLPDGTQMKGRLFWKNQHTKEQWKQLVEKVRNSKNNYTKFFECDTINDTLCVRTARSEDYFVMHESGTRKKVSRFYIDEKIPSKQRKTIYVLAENNRVLWIIGWRRCEECKVTEKSEAILQLTYEGD